VHGNCRNIFSEYRRYCAVDSSPRYRRESLQALLTSAGERCAVGRGMIWSSDPEAKEKPSLTVAFQGGLFVSPAQYSPKSGLAGRAFPYLRSWTLFGRVEREWRELDQQEATDALPGGAWHNFAIPDAGCVLDAVRLCHTGRNRRGTAHMHLRGFRLSGDAIGPREFVTARVADPGVISREASRADRAVGPDSVSERVDGDTGAAVVIHRESLSGHLPARTAKPRLSVCLLDWAVDRPALSEDSDPPRADAAVGHDFAHRRLSVSGSVCLPKTDDGFSTSPADLAVSPLPPKQETYAWTNA
jgi:hypothetical protein